MCWNDAENLQMKGFLLPWGSVWMCAVFLDLLEFHKSSISTMSNTYLCEPLCLLCWCTFPVFLLQDLFFKFVQNWHVQKYLSTLREGEYKLRFWYNILKCLSPFIMQCMQECACDKTQFPPSPHLAEVANCLTSEDYSPCKEPMENYRTRVWLLTWGWTPSPVSQTDVQRRRHLFVWVFLNIANNPVYVWLEDVN